MAYHKSRSKTHDYRSRCIYLITIVKGASTPVLSQPFGGLQSAVSVPGVRTTPTGDIVKAQLRNIPVNFPEARLLQYVVMPDHLHFVIDIQRSTTYHLGELIAAFTGDCTRAAGYADSFFEPGYHDRILRHKGQLRNMIDYVRDNPRRLIIKREHPDGRMFELCSEGRLLIISTGKASISKTISRTEALDMNTLAETIASDTRSNFTIIRRNTHRRDV